MKYKHKRLKTLLPIVAPLIVIVLAAFLVKILSVHAAGEPLTISAPVTLSGTNTITAPKFIDSTGASAYYIDPSAATSIVVAGTVTASSFSGALSGNGTTATTLIGDQTNWASYRTSAVANMLSWKNYGNGHVIFDASNSTSPTGSAVNNTNPGVVWTASYPTLMGWNGSNTFGVRVDTARYADSAGAAYPYRVGGVVMQFNWSGQGGQPSWLWGGEDGTNMYVYNPSNFSVNYAARAQRANGNLYIDDNFGNGVVGAYASTRYQGVFAMGDAYKLSVDGTTPGNLYGLAWTHSNVGGQSVAGLSHQLLVMENGITKVALGSGIWTSYGGYFGGNVGIGTAPSYKLQVAGSFYAGGSSREYKENIIPLTLDPSKIYDLNPVTFDYKPQYETLGKQLSGGRQFGLIAEDVYKIYPELTLSDGTRNVANVDYEKLSVLLLAEMKNQKNEIDNLKQRVDQMELQIKSLMK